MLVDRSLSNLTSREPLLKNLRDGLRPGQQEIADWQGGRLAVSAVPGAGKSTGMAVAAALAIARHQLHAKRQLVVVTFTRSAAANIKSKIREYLKTLVLPQGGFVVHTLHGLAWSIARSYPELSGLNPDSVLITPNQSHRLIRNSVEQWIGLKPVALPTAIRRTTVRRRRNRAVASSSGFANRSPTCFGRYGDSRSQKFGVNCRKICAISSYQVS